MAVHPRVCGEQRITALASISRFGSSPRVRGTGENQALHLLDSRFIPACAGNSGVTRPDASVSSVHPRVCGEQLL